MTPNDIKQKGNMEKPNRWPYLCLAIGTLLLAFSNGSFTIPLATWLAAVFILRFSRTQKGKRGSTLIFLAHIVAYNIAWSTTIPTSGLLEFLLFVSLMSLQFSVLNWLPYLSDRLVGSRLQGFLATLVFPLTWTTVEFLIASLTPFATWGSLAYTQHGNLPLVQIISITGIWGLTFLIAWFASVANWAWEQGLEWSRIRGWGSVYVGILALVLLFGGLRLVVLAPNSETVQVASIVGSSEMPALPPQAEFGFDDPDRRRDYLEILNYYLERTREQARVGAEIVIWQEYATYAFADDEEMFIQRGADLAREEGIYLLMAFITEIEGRHGELIENQAVWIGPDGKVIWQYLKSLPVVGEAALAGEGVVPVERTPYGDISSVICYDMDSPSLIRQAGRAGADLMLVPAFDTGITTVHTPMAAFRAIENGFSMVRATGEGVSAAYDYRGQVLSTMNYFTSPEAAMVAHVPMLGTRTIYSVVGDLFALLCTAGLVIIVGRVVFRR